jgi:CHAT domain-containing protein/tetratricopeptide (TPR) repeat protein
MGQAPASRFRSSPRRAGAGYALRLLALVILACALIASILWFPARHLRDDDSDREIRDLVRAAAASSRLIGPRTSGGFASAPRASVRGDASPSPSIASPELRLTVARLDQELARTRNARTLQRSGIARLVIGEVDHAAALLREAAALHPKDARIWSDLSAAHLVMAGLRPEVRGEQLARALDASSRAIALDPTSPDAWFTMALSAERVGLRGTARRSWSRFLETEDAEAWRQEGRQRLAAATRIDAASRWAQARQRLQDIKTPVPGVDLTALVAEDRQSAREWFGDELLGTWGSAVLAGDEAAATDALARAGEIAAAVMGDTGDALEADSVTAAQASAPVTRKQLATGQQLYARARALYDQDRRREAGELFAQAVPLLRDGGSPFWAWARLQQGLIAYHRRAYPETSAALDDVLSFTEPRGYRTLWARARWLQGIVLLQTDNPATAIEAYRDALTAFQQLGEIENAAAVSGASADSLRILGNADGGWNAMLTALERLSEIRRPIRRYNLLLNASLFALRENLLDASLQFQEAALEDAYLRGGPAAPLEALMRRAVVHHRRADHAKAAADLDRADTLLAEIVDPAQARYFAGWLDAVRGELLVASDPARARERLTKALPFFELSEPAEVPRLHLLLGRAARVEGSEGAVGHFEQGIETFEARRRALPLNDLRMSYFDEAWQLFAELMDVHYRAGRPALLFRDAERSRARSLHDRLDSSGRVTDISELQRRLRHGEAMLHYSVLPDRLLTWIVTSERAQVLERPVQPAGLAGDVDRYLDLLNGANIVESPAADRERRRRATALFDLLIRPALAIVPSDATLIVIGDGPLHVLPFSTLWDEPRGRYLLEDHVVIHAPSATSWRRGEPRASAASPARAQGGDILLVGNPDLSASSGEQLPALPHAEAEAREIAALYRDPLLLIGRDATRSRVLESISTHRIAHFASHAVVNTEFPSYSRLVLAADAEGQGALFAHEIAARPLRDTELVVLSACRTGRGPIRRGEGVLSLARPFMLAGASTVIASAWDVEDRAARELFRRFHRALRAGTPAPVALRDAQLALLKGADDSMRAPTAWGAFFGITTGQTTTPRVTTGLGTQ